MLDDVLVVLQRAELTTRMAEEIERDCVELGEEGRLIRMQLDGAGRPTCPTRRRALVYDYHAEGGAARTQARALRRARRAALRPAARVRAASPCSDTRASINPIGPLGPPRWLPRLSHIPRLPDGRRQAGGREPGRPGRDRPCVSARAGGGRGRRHRPRASEIRERASAPAAGAQSGRSLPADLALSRAFLEKVACFQRFSLVLAELCRRKQSPAGVAAESANN